MTKSKNILLSLFLVWQSINPLQGQSKNDEPSITKLNSTWPSTESLSFLDSEIENFNFIGASEFHRSKMALKQKKGFIQYLHQKKGLDKLVIEFPYAYGFWANKYLNTGDTSLLRSFTNKYLVFDRVRNRKEINHDSFQFFQWLYDFRNETQCDVEVVGLDFGLANNAELEIWSIMRLLKQNSLSVTFPKTFPVLFALSEKNSLKLKEVKKWRENFQEVLELNDDVLKSKLGDEYGEFLKILTSIDDVIGYRKQNKQSAYRERVLIRNFKREVNPEDVIYMQFGAGHLFIRSNYLARQNKQDYLMTAIEKEPLYSGRTLTVCVHFEDCDSIEEHSICKPEVLKDETYWFHEWIYGLKNNDSHDKLITDLNHQNSIIDLRKSSGDLLELSKLYQYLVVIF